MELGEKNFPPPGLIGGRITGREFDIIPMICVREVNNGR